MYREAEKTGRGRAETGDRNLVRRVGGRARTATATVGWQSHVVAVVERTTTTTRRRPLLSPGSRQTKPREGKRGRDGEERKTARRRFERPAGAILDAQAWNGVANVAVAADAACRRRRRRRRRR
jgi:hypothetical protein